MSILQKIRMCIKMIPKNQPFFTLSFYPSESEEITLNRHEIQIKFRKIEKDYFQKDFTIYSLDSWIFRGKEKEKIRIVYSETEDNTYETIEDYIDCTVEEEKCEDFISEYVDSNKMHSWLDELILFLI